MLIKRCRCKQVGRQFILPCRGAHVFGTIARGFGLWDSKANNVTKKTKAVLKAVRTREAEHFTLNGFRAGKATQMAKDGDHLALILEADNWKSKAFMRYLDHEKVEEDRALWFAMEASQRPRR